MEELSELLVILSHTLSQLWPVLSTSTHKPLLHQSPDILHYSQPLGLLLKTLLGTI